MESDQPAEDCKFGIRLSRIKYYYYCVYTYTNFYIIVGRGRERERGGVVGREERGKEERGSTYLFLVLRFAPFVEDPCCLSPGPMVYGMATCHSLTTIDGELTGDPLDLKMFNGTKWVSKNTCNVHMYTLCI